MPTRYFVSYSPHRFMTGGDEDGVCVLTRHSSERQNPVKPIRTAKQTPLFVLIIL